jgi:hypothetical protein
MMSELASICRHVESRAPRQLPVWVFGVDISGQADAPLPVIIHNIDNHGNVERAGVRPSRTG